MVDHSDGPNQELRSRAHGRRSVVPGLILTLIGGGGIAVILAADIGVTPELEKLAFRLGLALGPLLLGLAQVLLLIGLYLLWRATHPGSEPPE